MRVFQVNCLGCFVYALPLAERLRQQYDGRLNVLGLSTAFEDYYEPERSHYCNLVDALLGDRDFRLDCPEHQQKASSS